MCSGAAVRLAALWLAVTALFSMSITGIVRAQEALPEPPAEVSAEPPYTVAAERTVHNLINLFRLDHGLRPLESDDVLVDLARARCAIMAETGRVEHDIPGLGFGPDWLISQVRGPGLGRVGENLGASGYSNDVAMWSLFDAWVESPSHLENLLRPEYSRVGVGVVEIPTRIPGVSVKYVAQVFAVASGPLTRV
ncbi:MAG TPA: CAP domain-containing protein [Chloroflexota bacterium]|nr:CAP domain-containing protein [Chloroflexota bacterium]